MSISTRAPLNSLRLFAIRASERAGDLPDSEATDPPSSAPLAMMKTFCRIRDLPMSSTFDTVADIIAETCDIPRETITPDSHAIDDLGIDSLDFLDIAFAIDKAFGIKLPLEQWTQEVNEGKVSTEAYFVLKNLSARIDDLVAAKGA
jgi:acyl carrier protein